MRDPSDRLLARFRVPLLLVASALSYGTIGFLLIERVSVLDALYQTVLVLSTIGTGAPEPRGSGAKIFTITLILVGVAALFTAIGVGTEAVVLGELTRWLRRQRMTGRLSRMSDHFVVCAYGRVGRTVVLTARALNPSVRIIARVSEPGSADRLLRAGADEVISPYRLSGRRMALLALRPSMVEMLDLLGFGPDFRLEEVLVRAGSRLDGLTVAEALARYAGVSILAVQQPGTEFLPAPDQELRLASGDLILSVGPTATLDLMTE